MKQTAISFLSVHGGPHIGRSTARRLLSCRPGRERWFEPVGLLQAHGTRGMPTQRSCNFGTPLIHTSCAVCPWPGGKGPCLVPREAREDRSRDRRDASQPLARVGAGACAAVAPSLSLSDTRSHDGSPRFDQQQEARIEELETALANANTERFAAQEMVRVGVGGRASCGCAVVGHARKCLVMVGLVRSWSLVWEPVV